MSTVHKLSPELSESGFSEEEFFNNCMDSAYRIARSVVIREEGRELELAIVTGVQMGADGLSLDDKDKVNRDLLIRLHGKSLEELKQEQDEEIQREEAEWDSS